MPSSIIVAARARQSSARRQRPLYDVTDNAGRLAMSARKPVL